MKALKSKQAIAFVCFSVDYLRAKLMKFCQTMSAMLDYFLITTSRILSWSKSLESVSVKLVARQIQLLMSENQKFLEMI